MNSNYQTDYFLSTIKAMKDNDLMSAYENRREYNPEFVELLLEEMGLRGYDTTEIKKSFEDADIAVIKSKTNDELIELYYKRGNYKTGWDILAKNELKNRGFEEKQQPNEEPMFKHCFSFKGRIRRLEFGLSILIFFVYNYLLLSLFVNYGDNMIDTTMGMMYYILLQIPSWWFFLSQCARRSHDLGMNSWWTAPLLLLFADGDSGINKYGKNPKGKENFVLKQKEKGGV